MDLALVGGTLMDPASGRFGAYDIGIKGDRIVRVESGINVADAKQVVDVTGRIVTPGLIDLHTHVYHGGTSLSVDADAVARLGGTTTFIDAGSAGPGNFLGFHDYVIRRSRARILAFLNVSHAGIFGFDIGYAESADLALCDAARTFAVAEEYPREIIGIKVRVGYNASRDQGTQPQQIAKQAADRLGKPLMTHIDRPPPTVVDVLRYLGSGDILTHCFRPFPNQSIEPDGAIRAEILAARARGVIFDTGHGRGGFSFETVSKMMEQGFLPDVISSDVHNDSVNGPAYNLLHVMSKFLALGMPLETVIEKATKTPARAIDQTDLGHLQVGARADITVMYEEAGPFTFVDVVGEKISGDRRLVCDGLVIGGVYWA